MLPRRINVELIKMNSISDRVIYIVIEISNMYKVYIIMPLLVMLTIMKLNSYMRFILLCGDGRLEGQVRPHKCER